MLRRGKFLQELLVPIGDVALGPSNLSPPKH